MLPQVPYPHIHVHVCQTAFLLAMAKPMHACLSKPVPMSCLDPCSSPVSSLQSPDSRPCPFATSSKEPPHTAQNFRFPLQCQCHFVGAGRAARGAGLVCQVARFLLLASPSPTNIWQPLRVHVHVPVQANQEWAGRGVLGVFRFPRVLMIKVQWNQAFNCARCIPQDLGSDLS